MDNTSTQTTRLALVLALSAAVISSPAQADHHGDHHHGYWGPYYGAPAYYPRIGLSVNVLPMQPYVTVYGGANYYFSGGIWYRPSGARFIVVAPPLGIVVPILPPSYVVRPYGTTTYYVANDVYYTANASGGGYIVTAPPDELPGPGTRPPASANPSDRIFIYPRNGQTKEQQDADRFACHEWAVDQSSFDPTQAQGGSAARERGGKRTDYRRAIEACLDGRGYTVR